MGYFEQCLAGYESAFYRWVRSTSRLVDAKRELVDAFMHINYPKMEYSIDAISAMDLDMTFSVPQEQCDVMANKIKQFLEDIDEHYAMEVYRQETGEY